MAMVIKLPLTGGKFALVDDDDAAKVIAFRSWYAFPEHRSEGEVWVAKATGTYTSLHRLIAGVTKESSEHVSAINGNFLDCRRGNLRRTTRNNKGLPLYKNNTSGFKGVCFDKGYKKYKAGISHKGKNYQLGFFDKAEDAARAYDARLLEIHGPGARTNKSLGLLT